jgi:hypothetical protein
VLLLRLRLWLGRSFRRRLVGLLRGRHARRPRRYRNAHGKLDILAFDGVAQGQRRTRARDPQRELLGTMTLHAKGAGGLHELAEQCIAATHCRQRRARGGQQLPLQVEILLPALEGRMQMAAHDLGARGVPCDFREPDQHADPVEQVCTRCALGWIVVRDDAEIGRDDRADAVAFDAHAALVERARELVHGRFGQQVAAVHRQQAAMRALQQSRPHDAPAACQRGFEIEATQQRFVIDRRGHLVPAHVGQQFAQPAHQRSLARARCAHQHEAAQAGVDREQQQREPRRVETDQASERQ